MKTIDIKSLIIGVLLATTIIFGMGATGVDDPGAKVGRYQFHLDKDGGHLYFYCMLHLFAGITVAGES